MLEVHKEVRERKLALIEELLTRYPVDGIDLDFRGSLPHGSPVRGTSNCRRLPGSLAYL